MKREIDIIITASSRPELVDYCITALKNKMYYLGKVRFIFHEDFVFPKKSEIVIEQIKKYNIDLVLQTNPAEGLGSALMKVLSEVKTKYCFYLQEDWEFERVFDLDQIVWAMESDKTINSVIFNKNRTYPNQMGFQMKEYLLNSNLRLCSSPGWFLLPAVWRTEFVRDRWRVQKGRPEGSFTKGFGTHEQRKDPEYSAKHMGSYFYGGLGEYRYVRHLGDSWRMAHWRLEKGEPGGTDVEMGCIKNTRAPWLVEMPKRPSNKTKSGWFPE